MTDKMKVQAFSGEADEAKWWEGQQDHFADELEKAAASGELRQATTAKRIAKSDNNASP